MATFQDCIQGHVETNLITKRMGAKLIQEFNEMTEKFTAAGNPDSIGAATKMMDLRLSRMLEEIYAKILHINKLKDIRAEVDSAYARWDADFQNLNAAQKAMTKLIGMRPSKTAIYNEILSRADYRGDTLLAEYLEPLRKVFEKHHRDLLGRPGDIENFKEAVRQLESGEATGEVAEIVNALRQVNDRLVRDMKRAGAMMGRNVNYFPHIHDSGKIRAISTDIEAGKAEWKAFIAPLLDRNRMIDNETGMPLTGERLDEILDQSFDSLLYPERDSKAGEAWKKRSQMRVLQFSDGESFLKYNEKYGVGDEGLFDSYMSHISLMTKDLGIMQTLGPKAAAVHSDMMKFRLTTDSDGNQRRAFSDSMFTTLVGPVSTSAMDNDWLKFAEASKNIIRASLLDTAGITALTDGFFVSMAAQMNGMSGMKALGEWTKGIAGSKMAKEHAATGHYIANNLMAMSLSMRRLTESSGEMGGKTAMLSNLTNRLSGLHHVTEAGANALSMSFMGDLAAHSKGGSKLLREVDGSVITKRVVVDGRATYTKADGSTFTEDVMPESFQDLLSKGGIDETAWDLIRQADIFEADEYGASFLRPRDISSKTDLDEAAMAAGFDGMKELGRRVGDIEASLRYLATNSPALKTRALTTLGLNPSDWKRMVISPVFMFKSFPISVWNNHVAPMMAEAIKDPAGAKSLTYFGAMGTLGLSLGIMSIQMKEIVKGKDTREIDARMIMDAMFVSGGLGIFGDMALTDQTTLGNKLVDTLAGPFYTGLAGGIGTVTRIMQQAALNGNYEILDEGDAALFKFARRYIPAADIPLWATPVERALLDSAERWLDEDGFDKKISRMRGRMARDKDQDFWWLPANAAPSRTPVMKQRLNFSE